MDKELSGVRKFLSTRAGKWALGAAVLFVLALIGSLSGKQSPSTNQKTTTQNTSVTATQNTNTAPALPKYKVIPEEVHGTTRRLTVIVQSDITKQQMVDLNDNLLSRYSSGLTHLAIEYFDDETIASTYFQKVGNVSDAEADKLFVHYRGTYTLNQTTGFNKLDWNEPPVSLPPSVDNNHWVNIKTY